ncbi:hypothetical protein [Lactiplantibacillus plajomi]|uniref:Bacteriocin immunity protein n=1 Tax=Lactiplantibacillus plajomi TaxID=1457217 RepID=A0ABV6K5R2_9LACO|nr:hypothetical protein [Lactiplantibacillus plajomi]
MATKAKVTPTEVLDAVSRAALTLDRTDSAQSGLQDLLHEFRRTLLQTNGQAATVVLYQGKLTSYLLKHPATYPATVTKLSTLLTQFAHPNG